MKIYRTLVYLPLAFMCLWSTELKAQHLPTHLSDEGIYLFLDELASEQFIDLNSLMKPYARTYIAEKLLEAGDHRSEMSSRQQKELEFYLRDYMKEAHAEALAKANWFWQKKYENKRFDFFYYKDSLFQITVNPILGFDYRINENGGFYHWWNGVEAQATAGKFGIWASWRDNHESEELTRPDFQNRRLGAGRLNGNNAGGVDYEEFRGGLTYAWDWGHLGLVYDQFSWGENNHGSNILSGRAPAFPYFDLRMDPVKWFSFEYVHASLNSLVVDSALSFQYSNPHGADFRPVNHSKFLAANMFSFTPWQGLQLSVGNSIIYDARFPKAGFLVPVNFFRAYDRSTNYDAGADNNMNSQIYLSISSRNLKHFHFYGSWFIDELATDRIFEEDEFNFFSWKGGVSTTILPNTRMVAEYTWTNSLTFRHYIPTTTFESNNYNLGHYLEDNAKDLYLAAEYSPFRSLRLRLYYNRSLKGPDHTELETPGRASVPPFDPIVWESTRIGLRAYMQIVPGLHARLGYEWRNVTGDEDYMEGQVDYVARWTPEVYHGETGTLLFGLNFGF